ncbi:MAG: hypothetical protein ABR608_01805 [Pseudonocardiaceae bacterium]
MARARLNRDAGTPLPRALTRVADARATQLLLQGLALAAMVLVCVTGFIGLREAGLNLAPWAFFVTFWVGLVSASLLFGPIWRVLNPLRLLHTALAALLRIDPERGLRPLPDSLLIFDGPQTLILASDPFADGANLLGLTGRTIDYTVLSTATIAAIQVTAILLGHLVAAVGAPDRAVRLLPGPAAVRTQFPLLAAMIALTMGP